MGKILVGYKECSGVGNDGVPYGSVLLYYTEECKSFERGSSKGVGHGLECGEIKVYYNSFADLLSHIEVVGGEFKIGCEFEAYYTGASIYKALSMIMVKKK